ncbi:hypothetical protein AKO1_002882 [Acrasis kona]
MEGLRSQTDQVQKERDDFANKLNESNKSNQSQRAKIESLLNRINEQSDDIVKQKREIEKLSKQDEAKLPPIISKLEGTIMDLTRRLVDSESRCSILSESNGLLLMRIKKIEEQSK